MGGVRLQMCSVGVRQKASGSGSAEEVLHLGAGFCCSRGAAGQRGALQGRLPGGGDGGGALPGGGSRVWSRRRALRAAGVASAEALRSGY